MIQGSDEWFAARLGKVTASRVGDIIAKTKSGYSSSRANYMAELIVERLTGRRTDGFTNDAMKHGISTEAEARVSYEFNTDYSVTECGFLSHPTIAMSGASPDGLVNDGGTVGLLEIKCPNTATHIETLLSGNVPGKYVVQIQWQLACCPGRLWCDYVSFDPRLPVSMHAFTKRIQRDDEVISYLERQVVAFLEELDAKLCSLRSAYDLEQCLEDSI